MWFYILMAVMFSIIALVEILSGGGGGQSWVLSLIGAAVCLGMYDLIKEIRKLKS